MISKIYSYMLTSTSVFNFGSLVRELIVLGKYYLAKLEFLLFTFQHCSIPTFQHSMFCKNRDIKTVQIDIRQWIVGAVTLKSEIWF